MDLTYKSIMVKSINVAGKEEQLPPECALYEDAFTVAGDVMKHSLEIVDAPDFESKASWKLDCQNEHVSVYYKDLPGGRYFAGRCKVGISAKDLVYQFWDHLDTDHEWNDNIKSAKKLHPITDYTDIVTYTSNDVMIIKSREFLSSRCLRQHNNAWILAGRSIEMKEVPETKAAVRAYLHLGLGRSVPDPEDPEHSCIYDYIVCMDLKGMMFKSAVNQVMGRATLKDIENVRVHANTVLRKKLYPNL
ncbi:hypothetical protein PRIPAC_86181 [Pristionchus pacificus]|uniref:START domain-containing protein n=1 Tax=Pristionchus pacificus TaxID=54126 RepID=A0A2A6BUI0_PRIPA|nr:hypothetical protein PRIPAC_86181 [Pristionchus pacificus]|eukprot:PDM69476.1 hypothetical protein PRIPAC_44572 [Pristionchus pacificus]